ncbi:MAG: MATE family efflux transporter [Clostridia bacterium]|nr:MATE family efflux transporter [Clostridia bacterium]
MNSKTLFINTSPVKLFFIAVIPGSIGMLASALYQLIDGIFVGQILGATPFAALNLAMPFVIINFSLADLIGVGSSVPISINLGQKNNKEANNIFTCACIMIILSGILIGALLYGAAPILMKIMGAQGEFAALATQYLRVYALCSPLTTIVFAVDNYLRICGKINSSMFLNILMASISAVLEFVFLYIFKWGIWGAAFATCIGMIICALIAFVPFFRGNMLLHFCRPRFSFSLTKKIIVCGMPNFLNNSAARIVSVIMNMLLVRFGGETAVSVYGVLMYVEGFMQSVLYGMCDSLQPSVGYNWGAGKYSRVRAIEKCCFTASFIVSALAMLVIFVFPEQITHIFVTGDDLELLKMSVYALKIFSLTYAVRWLSFAAQSYMLAISKSAYASVISLSTALIFPLFFILILQKLELTGIWLNMPLTSLLAGILSIFIIFKTKDELTQKDL